MLEDIRRALVQKGRHIFIYGDRGVGKTSLAQTAAFEHHSAATEPLLLACDPTSGFYRIARDLAIRLRAIDPTVTRTTTRNSLGASYKGFISGEVQKEIERGQVPLMQSINEAVGVVEYVTHGQTSSKSPVVVIDEFERIQKPEERALFADFVKQLADQSVPLTLIFLRRRYSVGGANSFPPIWLQISTAFALRAFRLRCTAQNHR
jgi:Cdc6-like AAA superfamily ATPase